MKRKVLLYSLVLMLLLSIVFVVYNENRGGKTLESVRFNMLTIRIWITST